MMIYYNFWGAELPALIQGAQTSKRNLLPLSTDMQTATNQPLNNARLYTELLTRVTAADVTRVNIWENYLQPFWLDYMTRSRAAAPEGATGQYLVDCNAAWFDNTKELLTRLYEFCGTQYNTAARQEIQTITDLCDCAALGYWAELYPESNTPINTAANTRPAPEITAQSAPEPYRAKVLDILTNTRLIPVYTRLFDLGAFADNNGVWVWNKKNYTRWELALFIYLVDRIANYNDTALTIDADITKPINWKLFEGWICYNGAPLQSKTIKPAANDVYNKANEITTNPIYLAFLLNMPE